MRSFLLAAVVCMTVLSASAQTYNVTFQVNMNLVGAPFTTPEVNGTFNGWCGGCNPLEDPDGDGIWSTTLALDAGTYEYKFAYDGWAGQESLTEGDPCTVSAFGFTNRFLDLTGDVVLDAVCWGSCEACPLDVYDVTFHVNMNEVGAAFTTPEVNGTFNGWCGGCNPLEDPDGDGIWSTTISLAPGTYEYKFAYDGWAGQESLTEGDPCTVTAFGFTNRSLTVSDDTELDVVCWGSCTDCDGTDSTYSVTFQVNMNEVAEPFTLPEVNGTFNGWCGGCDPLEDADGDGIWTTTLSLTAGEYQYKFAYDAWAGSENLMAGAPCTVTDGGFTNRALTVTGDVVLDVVCWGSCLDCDVVEDMYTVTFVVDMNEVAAAFTTPEVNGTFNGWCGGCAPMADPDGDNVWTLDIELAAGTYEYKFAYDSWAGSENLTEGDPCTVTAFGFTNRSLVVSEDMVLDEVCWGSCEACDGVVDTTFEIIFKVNMEDVTETYTTPEVNGTFNGWCGGCAPMADPDGDDIWELTINLPAGIYEYKFAYDTWAGSENLTVGDPCTITTGGFTNRYLEVTGDADLGVVCWASCEDCDGVQVEDLNAQQAFSIAPNPANSSVTVQLASVNADLQMVYITDMTGRSITRAEVINGNAVISTEQIPAGMYCVHVTNGEQVLTQTFIVQH